MAVYRTKKVSNFTIIDNILIDDENLKIEEKGMMLILLRLPEDWNFSAKGLSRLTGKNKDTTNRILQSLEKKNYLHRTKYFENGKIAGTYYYVFETKELGKQFLQDIEKQDIEKQDIENRYYNQGLSKLSTILTNTNNKKEKSEKEKSEKVKSKKEKSKIERLYFDDKEVNNLFIEFLQIREKLKAVNSERAITMLINKLNEYDNVTKIKMIEQSIVNSWKGIFELKKPYQKKQLPEWFNKKNEKQKLTDAEQKEMEELMKEFKGD